MKKLMLIALAALPIGALQAQNVTGTWQGTLQAGRELRVVIKVSTTDADKLKAVMYSIDQGGQGIPSSAVSLEGSTVKMAIPGIGASYEGKLSADGNTINGTFAQGRPLALNLMRATTATAWAIPEPPPPPKRRRQMQIRCLKWPQSNRASQGGSGKAFGYKAVNSPRLILL